MTIELDKARAAQLEAWGQPYLGLEADYAMLEATKAAIEAQTEICPDCNGECELNTPFKPYWVICPTCKGRGRVERRCV
jgi:hypothetical protein